MAVFLVSICWVDGGGVGIANFNLATPCGNNPEVRPLTVYV